MLDLAHGTQFTGSSDIVGGSDISVVEGSHVVVITAGAKQNPGQSRIELAGVNAGILKTMLPQLLEVAPERDLRHRHQPVRRAHGARAGADRASRPSGSSPRARCSTPPVCGGSSAQRAGVSTSSVHAYIVGEHGDTEFPLWSKATIGTVPILEWETEGHPRMTPDELDAIAVDVRDAAYKVIQGKGATNYAIGLSSARIVEAILGDEHAVMPVSTVLHDYHGIDGVALSVPSVVSASGAIGRSARHPFSPNELALLRRSADALREVAGLRCR